MTQQKTVSPWLDQGDATVESEYHDYEQRLKDHRGIGGTVTITLTSETGQPLGAYGTIMFDTANGGEVVAPCHFALSREQAEQIVGIAKAEA